MSTTTFNLTIRQTRLGINKTPDKENYIFIATHKGGEELVKAFLDEYTNETGLTIKHIEEKEAHKQPKRTHKHKSEKTVSKTITGML